MKRRFKVGLLLKIVIAIVLGLTFSTFLPTPGVRIFVTINSIFSNFLSFSIPLIIVGLVAPGIADLGSGAGKLLGITALVAYISTLFAGFFSYFTCLATFPYLLPGGGVHEVSAAGTAAGGADHPPAPSAPTRWHRSPARRSLRFLRSTCRRLWTSFPHWSSLSF